MNIFGKKINKKGQIGMAIREGGSAFVYLGIFIVLISLVLGFGAKLVENQQADQTADGYAYNISEQSLQAMEDVGNEQSTFSSVGVIGVVIAILLAVFGGFLFSRGIGR